MHHENMSDNFDHGASRRWRCPGCEQVLLIPIEEGDPTLCSVCEYGAELDAVYNRKDCQHCGEPYRFDDDVIEIRFKCEHCNGINIWRHPDLWTHQIYDTEEGDDAEANKIVVILILVLAMATILKMSTDQNPGIDVEDILMILSAIGLPLLCIITWFFRNTECESCGAKNSTDLIERARTSGHIYRDTDRCDECGHERVREEYIPPVSPPR